MPFQDYDLILTLFTAEEGVIKLIIKRALFPKKNGSSIPVPLTLVECIYAKGRGELYKCHEISLLHAHLRIRDNLSTLEAACDMIQSILMCQPLHSPAPELYFLFKTYLEKLPLGADARAFITSFNLKILRHEGLMEIAPNCSICSCALTVHYLSLGEIFCQTHRPIQYQILSEEDMAYLLQLAHCTAFSQLVPIKLTDEFYEKMRLFFKERIAT